MKKSDNFSDKDDTLSRPSKKPVIERVVCPLCEGACYIHFHYKCPECLGEGEIDAPRKSR